MKLCIFGAGAVGSMIGSELALGGHDVTLISRGEHMAAIQTHGLTVIMNGKERHTTPLCTDNPLQAGPQDAVIFVVKAHQLKAAALQAAPLFGPKTFIVAAQNGIPWWYFFQCGGKWEGHNLQTVDPGKKIWETLDPQRVIGCVINGSCAIVKPGLIDHHQTTRSLTIGEPDGEMSNRCKLLQEAFDPTEISVSFTKHIRLEVWKKLLSNIGISMLCVLTKSPLGAVNGDPGCFNIAKKIMEETAAVASRLSVDLSEGVVERLKGGPISLVHKPSTLQDLEAGRPMEIDAITGAVMEIARLMEQATPTIDLIYALVKRLAQQNNCYPLDSQLEPNFFDEINII